MKNNDIHKNMKELLRQKVKRLKSSLGDLKYDLILKVKIKTQVLKKIMIHILKIIKINLFRV